MKPSTSVAKTANILAWIVGVIFVLLPFHEFLVVWVGSNTGHLDVIRIWKEILIALMLPPALWLVWRNHGIRRWLFGSWIVRLFVLYVLLHVTLGIWALMHHQVNRTALIYALIINLRFFYFFILCAVAAACSGFLKHYWAKLVLWPAAAVILFGILQRFFLANDFLRHFGYGPTTIPAYQTVDSNPAYPRLQSTLRGPNPLGAYLVLIITIFVAFLRKNRNLFTGLLLLSLIVLFYSYSRSAWIGLAVAVAILAGLRLKVQHRRPALAIAAILIVALGLGLYGLRDNQAVDDALLHTSSGSTSVQSSNAVRALSIKNGINDIANQPWGRGPGTAGPASYRNDHPVRNPEDYYLQIGQEVGVEGMTIFIAINILTGVQLWHRRRDNLAAILFVSLVGLSVVNLFLPAWTDDTLAYVFWGLAGIACAPVIMMSKHKLKDGQKLKNPA